MQPQPLLGLHNDPVQNVADKAASVNQIFVVAAERADNFVIDYATAFDRHDPNLLRRLVQE